MPRVDAVVSCPIHESFRVKQVAGMFDVPLEEKCRERFGAEVPDETEDWQIGVIVGPSGSGKTTIARKAYGDKLSGVAEWPADRAVVDCFGDRSIRDITRILTAVGFSSPPAWVKPYHVLSNGEKFRCDLARALLDGEGLVAFDEFTSVVDRTVAKVGSAAVAKSIRGGRIAGRRFVAVSCHYDILDWLEPDWVLDMATRRLERGRLRRPEITVEVVRCRYTAWRLFAKHHYLNRNEPRAAHCYLATWDGLPVGFVSVLPKIGMKNMRRLSRTVVLPDYQGIGIGSRLSEAVASIYKAQGFRVTATTANPAMIAHRRKSPLWRTTTVMKTGASPAKHWKREKGSTQSARYNGSTGRAVVSFEYVGDGEPHQPKAHVALAE